MKKMSKKMRKEKESKDWRGEESKEKKIRIIEKDERGTVPEIV